MNKSNHDSIKLKPASIEDAEFLLNLRNDPLTRHESLTSDKIKEKDHLVWLANLLKDKHRKLFIAEANGTHVGTVRSDYGNDGYELSWAIAPHMRGKGFGKTMVAKLSTTIKGSIFAKIKEGNKASVRIAKYCGMNYEKKENGILYYKKTIKKSAMVSNKKSRDEYS